MKRSDPTEEHGEDKNELILTMKELIRQWTKMRNLLGDAVLDEIMAGALFQDMERSMADLLAGRTTPEEAQRALDENEERIARFGRETGDPGIITSLDAENESKAKELPETAQLLAKDAANCAAAGQSKEQWISDVLSGHAGDDAAQLGCLKHIVRLWSDGPWPWPQIN